MKKKKISRAQSQKDSDGVCSDVGFGDARSVWQRFSAEFGERETHTREIRFGGGGGGGGTSGLCRVVCRVNPTTATRGPCALGHFQRGSSDVHFAVRPTKSAVRVRFFFFPIRPSRFRKTVVLVSGEKPPHGFFALAYFHVF